MAKLTWFELSKVAEGTRVRFAETHDIFPQCVVPAGTEGVIDSNWLNEMHNMVSVFADDLAVRKQLADWGGAIILGQHLDSGVDLDALGDNPAADEWHSASPLELADGSVPKVPTYVVFYECEEGAEEEQLRGWDVLDAPDLRTALKWADDKRRVVGIVPLERVSYPSADFLDVISQYAGTR